MKITVGIPAYNEEKNIASIIVKLKQFAETIIVCNDGSTDSTSEIAQNLGAIVIIAFLFSAIHLDPEGIIPRFVLGVLLGYLYYWSKSLWLPILAHFVNNAQAIIFSYPLFKIDSGAYSLFSEAKVDPMMGLFSFASVVLLLYVLYQNLNIKKG